jgi:hypothetical protein
MIRTNPKSFIPLIKEFEGFEDKSKSEQDKVIDALNTQKTMEPLNCPSGFSTSL